MTKPKVTSKTVGSKKIKSEASAAAKTAKAPNAVKSSSKKPATVKSAAGSASQKTVSSAKPAIKKTTANTSSTGKAGTQKKKLSPRDQKIQGIKMVLLKQRSSLLNEAETALNELPDQTIFPDLGDQATAETDRNFMLRLRGREQRLLKKIDEAVERIDSGTFGICDDCGNEIDIKRLEARPVTTMCIECKTLQEEEEKLRES